MTHDTTHCGSSSLPVNHERGDTLAEAKKRGVPEAQVWNERAAADLSPRERMLKLIAQVAEKHGVKASDILSKQNRKCRGTKSVSIARHAAVAAVHLAFPHMSSVQLGRLFNRDHSTILHSISRAGLEPIKKRRVGSTPNEGELHAVAANDNP